MDRAAFKQTLAVRIVAALGAYCPRVKMTDEKILAEITAKEKRHTRPRIGRGAYGKNLRAHFDRQGVEGIHFSGKSRTARMRVRYG